MRRHKHLLTLLLYVCSSVPLFALSEESVKAAFLERFAMFIQWPKPIDRYTVCVYDDEPFAQTLQKNYASRPFNNRPVTVVSLKPGGESDEMLRCHILYFRGSKPQQNETLLNALRKNSVLLISDDKDDTRQGAMIGFYLQNNTFRFVINQRSLENADLAVSYKLLNFATVIEPTGGAK